MVLLKFGVQFFVVLRFALWALTFFLFTFLPPVATFADVTIALCIPSSFFAASAFSTGAVVFIASQPWTSVATPALALEARISSSFPMSFPNVPQACVCTVVLRAQTLLSGA